MRVPELSWPSVPIVNQDHKIVSLISYHVPPRPKYQSSSAGACGAPFFPFAFSLTSTPP